MGEDLTLTVSYCEHALAFPSLSCLRFIKFYQHKEQSSISLSEKSNQGQVKKLYFDAIKFGIIDHAS
jgi:hypothetical protein